MVLTIILTTWVLVFARAMYAITVGSKQRLDLLNAIRDDDPWLALKKLEMFGGTSFDVHIWRVATFRDPWSLYPAGLADEVKAVR